MPKKKTVHRKSSRKTRSNHKIIGYIIVATGFSMLLLFVKVGFDATQTQVLGASTMLARGGNDTEGGSGPNNSVTTNQRNVPSQQFNLSGTPVPLHDGERLAHRNNEAFHRPNPSISPQTEEQSEKQNQLEGDNASGGAVLEQDNDTFSVEKNGVRARTHFPLTIDPTTNQLIVTTPAGTKVVAVLPDQAVQNMINKGLITTVASGSGSQSQGDGTEVASDSGSTMLANSGVTLTTWDNNVVYAIPGKKDKKLLGFVPVTINKTLDVSVNSGELLNTDETLGQKLLDFLSF